MPPVVDVLVPVYRGLAETRACLESLLAAPNRAAMEIVVLDDASPEPELSAYVRELAGRGLVTLLVNPANLGFPATVNRGFALHQDRDVVVLNSDTVVFPGWLDRLARAAHSASDVGSATPFSNNATICSYPRPNQDNSALQDITPAELDALFAARNAGAVRDLPTAVGFCMYIRRDCLVDAGYFDEHTFGTGYAEENDFCLRSARLGWRHVLAGDVFVRHSGQASFGAARKPALERNLALLERRFPLYLPTVLEWNRQDPLLDLRRNVDRARLERLRPQPTVVQVCHGLSGGTARRLRDERAELAAAGFATATLLPDTGQGGRGPDRVRLEATQAPDCPNLRYRLPQEQDLLAADLARLGATELRLHHFMDVPPALLELAGRMGLPQDAVVHDFAWFCPRINCIDDTRRHCAEPSPEVCQRCVDANGADFRPEGGVAGLIERSSRILLGSRRVAAPSADAAGRMMRHFPGLSVMAVPHGEPAFAPPPPPPAWDGRSRLRLAVIGAIGPHKGFEVLKACALDAARRDLPLEFRVVGFSADDAALYATGRVHITGEYAEEEALELIARQRCHAALFLSVWPETWCYTLTQAWRAGLCAFGFDLGAIGERIRATGWGWPVPLSLDGQVVNDHVLAAFSGRAQPGLPR
ncbi:glycosyltransferase [Fundidesulfovibrio soli]|uniref:glycosyltransferase n=1 Tax=Fundidesulfovibrio soli TaxID=2922716 RepID=UPI001FB04619|nr:glycosyltransferase [Fundidesulfovibrio soli]